MRALPFSAFLVGYRSALTTEAKFVIWTLIMACVFGRVFVAVATQISLQFDRPSYFSTPRAVAVPASDVFALRYRLQMSRVNASPMRASATGGEALSLLMAGVIQSHANRYWPFTQDIRDPVRELWAATGGRSKFAALSRRKLDNTVASFIERADPFEATGLMVPATSSRKTFFYRWRNAHGETITQSLKQWQRQSAGGF
jgi:hypothetical protein